MAAKARLILNSTAGAARTAAPIVRELAEQANCEVCETAKPGHAAQLAREGAEAGVRRIIVAGGDGAIHEVVNGIAPDFDRIELGIVPLGSGNDLARSLDIPLENLPAAVRLAVEGPTRPIDLVQLTDGSISYIVNSASGGIGGEVTAHVPSEAKQRWGAFAYWMTAVGKVVELQTYQTHISIDGDEIEQSVYGIAVGNGRFIGGGFPIAPAALLDDGLLDITIIPELPTLELLSAGLEFAMGDPNYAGHLVYRGGSRLQVRCAPPMMFSLDGEPQREVDATFLVLPRVLRVAAGEKAALHSVA